MPLEPPCNFGLWTFDSRLYIFPVSKKSAKIAALIHCCQGREHDAHYRGYFECFNRGLFYEAHDVLEEIWVTDRKGPNGAFYKGLIQLAGAFVLLQKNRLAPAARLFKLCRSNLQNYASPHQQLDVAWVLRLIEHWLQRLEVRQFDDNPFSIENAPKIHLLKGN